MINKAIITRLVVLSAISLIGLPANPQDATPASSSTTKTVIQHSGNDFRRDKDSATDRDKRDGRTYKHVYRRDSKDDHGDRRRHDPEAFRQLMNAELSELPTLNQRMARLMDIQAKRFELQKQRQVVARTGDGDREVTIKKFHGLLRRDQELSDDARKIVQEIVKDMPVIQKELDKRRSTLDASLAKANAATTDTETSSSEARDLRRRMRYLDYLQKKLGDLKTHPERLDLLARVLRGLPFEDPGTPGKVPDKDSAASSPEARLSELLLKRQILKRELKEVNDEIEDLRKKGIKPAPKKSKELDK